MAKTEHYYTRFLPGHFYHIFNRAVDRKPLFRNPGNYQFFLQQYTRYMNGFAETYAYCLLPNHFHLLIRIPDELPQTTKPHLSTHSAVSRQFRRFFQSYAMAFNKQQNRLGTLFQTPFKRALIDRPEDLPSLVCSIHKNPQFHGLAQDFKLWPWTSYQVPLKPNPSAICMEVLNWFGNPHAYLMAHLNHPWRDALIPSGLGND